MIQKYIIDKTDIHDLLTGKEIPLPQGNKARAFCVEVSGELTNGEVIKALFPNTGIVHNVRESKREMLFSDDWWNAPYQKGGE